MFRRNVKRRCPTGKKKYTKKEAQHQVNYQRSRGRIVRAYPCCCNWWHLTHNSKY